MHDGRCVVVINIMVRCMEPFTGHKIKKKRGKNKLIRDLPLQKLPENCALAFNTRLSGITWVISVSYTWLTVTLETTDQLSLKLVTQTIPEIKLLNASNQSSQSFWSGQFAYPFQQNLPQTGV